MFIPNRCSPLALIVCVSGLALWASAQDVYFTSVSPPCTDAVPYAFEGWAQCSSTGYCSDMTRKAIYAEVAWNCDVPYTSSAATNANQRNGCPGTYSAIWAEATTGVLWSTQYDVNGMCWCDLDCQIDEGWEFNCGFENNSGTIDEPF